MPIFKAANILLPGSSWIKNWPVVACDQFSSQPDYWSRVQEATADVPSALQLILPEAWLNTEHGQDHQKRIPAMMKQYLEEEVFEEYPDALIYVERELTNHKVRRGLVGVLDLDAYNYMDEDSPIRSTEQTIIERIPARADIRREASLEIPHVLLLADDAGNILLEDLSASKDSFMVLYDLDLMEEGGHIRGWLVNEEHKQAFYDRLHEFEEVLKERYSSLADTSLVFAVGDGNHSLAAAKALWEEIKPTLNDEEILTHPARYAMAELENIHDDSQEFEPIHRLVTNVSDLDLLYELNKYAGAPEGEEGFSIHYYTDYTTGAVHLNPALGEMPVAILQEFLDGYLASHEEAEIDYIHGADTLKELASQPRSIGFVLPPVSKSSLFRQVISKGSLPRKTFSMGHANEKRYYMEARKIVDDSHLDAASDADLAAADEIDLEAK